MYPVYDYINESAFSTHIFFFESIEWANIITKNNQNKLS